MKNIDTLEIQLVIQGNRDFIDNKIKRRLFPNDCTRYGKYGFYQNTHPFLGYSFKYIQRGWYLIVTVEHSEMIGVETAEELQEKVIYVVTNYFDIPRSAIVEARVVIDKKGKRKRQLKKLDLVEINRIEYKTDYKLECNDEEIAVQDIIRIAPDNFNVYSKGLYKYKSKGSERINCTYIKDKNKKYKKDYMAFTVYFKEYERLEAGDAEGAKKFQGIVRTEIKVKNARLNYERKNRDKTLKNYFKEDMAHHYFKNLEKIFYTENYYRLDVACLKIKANEGLPEFKKKRLCAFITRINEVGITDIQEEYDPQTFRNYIKDIRNMGINPLCYSKNINGKEISIKQMLNFTVISNGIEADI